MSHLTFYYYNISASYKNILNFLWKHVKIVTGIHLPFEGEIPHNVDSVSLNIETRVEKCFLHVLVSLLFI